MSQSESYTPERAEFIAADYLLEPESSPEEWFLAFEQYFNAGFANWQLQARVEPESAMNAYRDLLGELAEHENELALLYRTGGHGRLYDEGYFGTSSGANQIEDVIIFQINQPSLEIEDLSDFINPDEQRPNNLSSIHGIRLEQLLVAYDVRTTESGNWHRYFPQEPGGQYRMHDAEPAGGVITLSLIDQYRDFRSHQHDRGLEYALKDDFKYPSISVSPTRHDKHMRIHIGNEAVSEELAKQSWFDQVTKEQVSSFIR